jgi:putative phosphoribosyl transferase
VFADRADAGRRLGAVLRERGLGPCVVVGLPRGGVPVAYEVARALSSPLDVIVVRKLGVPFQPELAMGAVGEDGVVVRNERVLDAVRLDEQTVASVRDREQQEVRRRAARLRGRRPRLELAGRTVVVVDDGVATGSTAQAACEVARAHGAARVVLAVPVGPAGFASRFAGVADEVVYLAAPASFAAVGQFYRDFRPTTDEEVATCLSQAAQAAQSTRPGPAEPRGGPPRP